MGDGNNEDNTFSLGHLCTHIPDVAYPIVGGCVAFGTSLAASTAAQKAIGVSTATAIVPSLFGFATVCAASLVTEQTAILTHEMKKDPKKRNLRYIIRRIQSQIPDSSINVVRTYSQLREGKKRQFKLPMHEVRV